MLQGLRCDNEERVWECAYATAFVHLLFKARGEGRSNEGAVVAYLAQDIADDAVLRLRAMRDAR